MNTKNAALAFVVALASMSLAPVASAHWGPGIPAHHISVGPGRTDVFGLSDLWCVQPGPPVSTHASYLVGEALWHTMALTLPSVAFQTPPPAGDIGLISLVEGIPSTAPNHDHHVGTSINNPGGTAAPELPVHNFLVDSLTGSIVLVATVVNPPRGRGPDILFPPFAGDITPGGPGIPGGCPGTHDPVPIPQSPTGVDIAIGGADTSVQVTLPCGSSLPLVGNLFPEDRFCGFQDGSPSPMWGCFDVGDNDFDLDDGGGSFLVDLEPTIVGDPLSALAGIWLFGCGVPPDMVDKTPTAPGLGGSNAGYIGQVQINDLALPPNGAPYTVCFDYNGDGTCVLNPSVTSDAWDQCLHQRGVAAPIPAIRAVSIPTAGNTAPPYYVPVDTAPVSFEGHSVGTTNPDDQKCWPRKASTDATLSAGGPGTAKKPAPSVTTLRSGLFSFNPSIRVSELIVFTSTCVDAAMTPTGSCGDPITLDRVGAATLSWVYVS